jgi:hypothetical protein
MNKSFKLQSGCVTQLQHNTHSANTNRSTFLGISLPTPSSHTPAGQSDINLLVILLPGDARNIGRAPVASPQQNPQTHVVDAACGWSLPCRLECGCARGHQPPRLAPPHGHNASQSNTGPSEDSSIAAQVFVISWSPASKVLIHDAFELNLHLLKTY